MQVYKILYYNTMSLNSREHVEGKIYGKLKLTFEWIK